MQALASPRIDCYRQEMSWVTRIGILLCVLLGCWVLMGCSVFEGDEAAGDDAAEEEVLNDDLDPAIRALQDSPPEEIYAAAQDAFVAKQYPRAIELFELVEQEHPFSEWAKRAQIMAAYAAYRNESFDEASLILERFVKLHPNNPNTPYAYYLRALTYYDQIVDVGRDQRTTELARQSLRDVVSRFPDSDYARDAAIKLELTDDHLAGKEMEIGRYYLEREEFIAAINRFKRVIEEYETTSHAAEALHRLVESYLQLGVKPEAQKYAAVLGYNYPGSEWYDYSYRMLDGEVDPRAGKREEGWADRLIPSL